VVPSEYGDDDYEDYVQREFERELDRSFEMHRWFQDLYFDPDQERREGVERAYRWLPQDVVDPVDVLTTQFRGTASQRQIEEVAGYFRARSRNWRARPDELPPQDNAELNAPARDDHRARSPSRAEKIERISVELLAALTRLEVAVSDVQVPEASFSHNHPPEALADLPATKQDLRELKDAVDALRLQALASAPQRDVVVTQQHTLLSFARKVATWTGERGIKFVDAAMDAGGKAAGAALVLKLTGLLPHVLEAAAAAERLVQALAH
jgi:hypothetical protein